ncbi:MAG: NlpC/P60 family protein [Actinomycetota bacterium]
MSTAIAKLGAIAAASAIIATAAIPAYADFGSTADQGSSADLLVHRTAAVQSVSVLSSVALTASARDAYTVTKAAPASSMLVNRYTGIAPPAQAYSGAALIAYAAQFVGLVPYGEGNSPTTSFSCDGYTQYVFAGFGISLPRGADHQAALGVRIDQSQAVAGDLVWWPGRHVGIYDGNGGMYNSPTWGRYVEHADTLWGSPVFIRLTVG